MLLINQSRISIARAQVKTEKRGISGKYQLKSCQTVQDYLSADDGDQDDS